MRSSLRADVEQWLDLDPDAHDRATIQALLDAHDEVDLERRFGAPLTFGTAGLRGPVMAGAAGMNRLTVRRATQGVIAWLRGRNAELSRGVVVGRDARHGSEAFNDEVVAVLLGAGVDVHELPGPLPTPFVPYCVKALGAIAGIMITASHNPPDDNGYKLYDSDGAQIVPPNDVLVERFAREAGAPTLDSRRSPHHHVVTDETLSKYREHLVARFGRPTPSSLRIAYTPLHGVGGETMTDLFALANYPHVTRVNAQFRPDGDFPTLPFPNPEEPGALDLAIATASESGSTLIIANDPDADRLGAAIPSGDRWRVLRGDEIGRLIASYLLKGIAERGEVVATTIVSSSMLATMATAADVTCTTTLTGFKWLARAAGSATLGFGYEEALGFAVDPFVADKDGLSAALALCALADELASAGATLQDLLDELEARYGVHATAQVSLRADGAEALDALRDAVTQLRRRPPDAVASIEVTAASDLADGWRGLPSTEGVVLELGDLARVIVRPSGTEAKVKAYLEVTPPRVGSLTDQRDRANEVLEQLDKAMRELLRA